MTTGSNSEFQEYGYSTRMLLAPDARKAFGTQEVLKRHETLPAVLAYLTFNNLLPGTPQPSTAFVEVLHADGRALTQDELNFLEERGRTEQGYIELATLTSDPLEVVRVPK